MQNAIEAARPVTGMREAAPSVSAPRRTCRLLGLDFADLDLDAAASLIDARPAGAAFAYVVTPNADHLVRLSRNPGLLPLYTGAMLRLMDSRVVARAARLFGLPAPPVVTGSDLTARLLVQHLRPRERVTIIGLRQDALAELVRRTGMAPPAHYDPPMGLDRDLGAMARAVQFVLDHPARLIFLAVGSPRQERLAAAIAAAGGAAGTALCVGASLEFLAGVTPRAPRLLQAAGAEWLHRLAADPRRLARRYLLENPLIFQLLWRDRFGRRPPEGRARV